MLMLPRFLPALAEVSDDIGILDLLTLAKIFPSKVKRDVWSSREDFQ